MHYIDRSKFKNAPIDILAKYHKIEQQKWLNYKNNKINKPDSKWNNDIIRNPLATMFFNNCGYCGINTTPKHDGEIDHFYPIEKDVNAEKIYKWNNYVWSCPRCNRKKSNNFPILNPCDLNEVKYIYIDEYSGKYLVLTNKTPIEIIEKHKNTVEWTYINGKNNPEKRKRLISDLKIKINNLIEKFDKLEFAKLENNLINDVEINEAKNIILQEKECGDYLLLINEIILKFDFSKSVFENDFKHYVFNNLL